jgi:periplasmic protein TonB
MHDAQSRKYREASLTSERRLTPRFPVKPVEYVEVGDHNGGIILDISQAGMAVSTAQSLGSNRVWKFRFQLPRSPETIEALAEISWLGETKKRAGVRFVDLPAAALGQILEWIRQQSGDNAVEAAEPFAGGREGAATADAPEDSLLDEITEVVAEPKPAANGGKFSKIAFSSPVIVPGPPAKEVEKEEHDSEEVVSPLQAEAGAPEEPRGERRGQMRKAPVSALYLRLDDGNAGLIENLSETGMSFRAAKSLHRDLVIGTFQIPGTDKTIETPVSIVWTSASKKKVGARFTELSEEAKYRIAGWVDAKMVARNRAQRPEKSPAVRGAYRAGLALVPDALPEEIARRNRDTTPAPSAAASPAAALDTTANREVRSALAKAPVSVALPVEQLSASPPTQTMPAPSAQRVAAPPVAPAAFESILLPLDGEHALRDAPQKPTFGFWKIAAAVLLLGAVCFVCFKAGVLYSKKDRPVLPESVVANRVLDSSNAAKDTSEIPVSEADASETSAKTFSAAPGPDAEKPRHETSTTSSNAEHPLSSPARNSTGASSTVSSTSSNAANGALPSAKNRPSQSPADIPLERNVSRDSGTSLKPLPSTPAAGSSLVPLATRSGKAPASASASFAAKQSDAGAKPEAQPVTQQPAPSSDASASPSPAASGTNPPAALSKPAAPEPVQPPAGTVSFFSRFRSIRNMEGSAGGVLQIGPLLTSPLPTYPVEARRKQVQGIVELLAVVAADGNVETVQFIKGPADLADAALDAARQWHYGSTVLGGRPVASEQSIYFTFKLAK